MARKQILTTDERSTLVTIANAFLADGSNSQDSKQDVFNSVSNMLLHHCGEHGYKGYNYIKWIKQGGASQFFADYPDRDPMTPEIQKAQMSEKYMGAEYDRFFY